MLHPFRDERDKSPSARMAMQYQITKLTEQLDAANKLNEMRGQSFGIVAIESILHFEDAVEHGFVVDLGHVNVDDIVFPERSLGFIMDGSGNLYPSSNATKGVT